MAEMTEMLNNKELADVLRGTGYPYLAHSFTKMIYNEMTEPIPIGMYSRHFKTYLVYIMYNIDWSEFTWSEDTCYCRCGRTFKSHAKYITAVKRMTTRRQCPQCGKDDDCWRVTSDPETMTI